MHRNLCGLLVFLGASCGLNESDQAPSQDPNDAIGSTQRAACGGSPAPALFEHAMCLCGGLDDVGMLKVGPGVRGEPASIAVNGLSRSVSYSDVNGDWHAYGGLKSAADLEIKGHLISGGDVDFVGRLHTSGDLRVGGNLAGAGHLSVEGALSVGGETRTIGLRSVSQDTAFSPLSGPPCACDERTFLDIERLVDDARIDNDNEVRDLGGLLHIGDGQLRLQTGRYYFEDVASIGRLKLVIDGVVSMFLKGDLATIGDHQIEILNGGALDLYVSGSVGSVGRVRLGDPDRPSAFRLYIGGDRPIQLGVGQSLIAGSIYAPRAYIAWVGQTIIDGAIFARELDGVGQLKIAYVRPTEIEVPPQMCPPTKDPEDPEEPETPQRPQVPNL